MVPVRVISAAHAVNSMGAGHRHSGRHASAVKAGGQARHAELDGFLSALDADGQDPPATPNPSRPFILQCHTCGFEPDDQLRTPAGICPKCHAQTWERWTMPGSLLAAAIAQERLTSGAMH